MVKKPLSALKKFKTGIVLSGDYMNNPSVNGSCEFGIRKTRANVELWLWYDEMGGECVERLAPEATWRDVVNTMVGNEMYWSTISLESASCRGTTRAIGQILCLAWSEGDSEHDVARILARIDDESLDQLANMDEGLLDGELLGELYGICEDMRDNDLDIGDLPALITLKSATFKGVTRAVGAEAKRMLKEAHAAEREEERRLREREKRLAPFSAGITAIIDDWSKDKPYGRYPGGVARVPPAGLKVLRAYIEEYVIANQSLPVGVHSIPGGRGSIGQAVAPFEVIIKGGC